MRWPDFRDLQLSVAQVYEQNGFKPLWLVDGQLTSKGRSAIEILSQSPEKGLNPEDYDVPRLRERLLDGSNSDSLGYRNSGALDVSLTIDLMRYASALHQGRIHPCQAHFAIRAKDLLDPGAFVREYLSSDQNLAQHLAKIEPPFRGYSSTLAALVRYQQLASQPEPPMPKRPPHPLKRGDRYSDLPALTSRLRMLRDLKTVAPGTTAAQIYDGPVFEAVKRFQWRHGLAETGTLDFATYQALTTPVASRVEQLKLTLERWRWLPSTITPAIVVNLPEFELRAFDEDKQMALRMRVIVGKAYRHRTPVFEDQLNSVIVRPPWNVPLSIQKSEIVPQARKDPAYLREHDLIAIDQKGQAVAWVSEQDLLNRLESGNLRLRQLPGPSNSLGLLKFDFPNEYSVYLHGTPANELFSKARRDFSHGCIRVEDPISLAEWVLRRQGDWNRERIVEACAGIRTLRIPVSSPISVLVLYGTAVVENDGEVRFFNDIYGYDAELRKALSRGYPYALSSCGTNWSSAQE